MFNPYAAPTSETRAPPSRRQSPGVVSTVMGLANVVAGGLGCLGSAYSMFERPADLAEAESVLFVSAFTLSSLAFLVAAVAFFRGHRLRWWLQLSPFVIFFGCALVGGLLYPET